MLAPPIHRNLKTLNRELFRASVQVLAVRVPSKSTGLFLKTLSKNLFNQPKLRNVVEDTDNNSKDTRLILLNPSFQSPELDDLADQQAKDLIQQEALGVVKHTVEVGYDYWTTDEILRAVLPEHMKEVPSAFTQIGHIAHMNLRDEYLPFKNIIGQVILDKNATIKTVVNKVDVIDSTFRNFQMEVLAGENNMIAEMKENNCRFRFDFSKVYWNSRLHAEHERLINTFQPGEYVCDVFAGVGPFALPATKRGCVVYANDLNPVSYQYMNENIALNKIKSGIHTYNLDGREFIRKAVQDLAERMEGTDAFRTFDHFVMNLPATAIEFLDAFRGLYRDQESKIKDPTRQLPLIHCHCFTKHEDPRSDILGRVAEAIGAKMDDSATLHFVRSVAPNKDMYCVSFRLSSEVAFASFKRKDKAGAQGGKEDEGVENGEKRLKM
ncbi:uncharacterized protein VTP21DRAFT_3655 [Calcarisporiella thermophila]|uniref:uncharacterized protein n=1 Tax=Calcarisporiella thermophila TaxID=911321 RepID=UPI00374471B9